MISFIGFLLVIVVPIVLGSLLSEPFHMYSAWAGRCAVGTVVGLTLFAVAAFILCCWTGVISWTGIIGADLCLLLATAGCRYLRTSAVREQWPLPLPESRATQVACITIILGLSTILLMSFREVLHTSPDGYLVGFRNNFGDLGLHIHYMASFLHANNLPPMNPIFAGVPLRYSVLIDFYSSVVWFGTGNLERGLELPGLLLSLSLMVLFVEWIWHLTGRLTASVLSVVLFFFSGSPGFVYWLLSIPQKGVAWETPSSLGWSMLPEQGIHWPNLIDALLIPQRGLQLAFPLVLLVASICMDAARTRDRGKFLFAALLAMGLPIIHAHSLPVLAVVGIVFIRRFPCSEWLWAIVPVVILWLPQALYLTGLIGPHVEGAQGFIRLIGGWMNSGWEFPLFWIKNTGWFFPAFLFFFWRPPSGGENVRILGCAGLILFVLGNTICLAPWEWDNVKLFIYWYLFSVPLVAAGLVSWFEQNVTWKIAAGSVIFLSLILSGFLDVCHALLPGGEDWPIYVQNEGRDDIAFASWIQKYTSPNAIFLAAPTANQPVQLAGRTVFLGYAGHIWSHGLPLQARATDLDHMLKGDGLAKELLKKHRVSYVVAGAAENESQFGFNHSFYDANYGRFAEQGGTVIYRVATFPEALSP